MVVKFNHELAMRIQWLNLTTVSNGYPAASSVAMGAAVAILNLNYHGKTANYHGYRLWQLAIFSTSVFTKQLKWNDILLWYN